MSNCLKLVSRTGKYDITERIRGFKAKHSVSANKGGSIMPWVCFQPVSCVSLVQHSWFQWYSYLLRVSRFCRYSVNELSLHSGRALTVHVSVFRFFRMEHSVWYKGVVGFHTEAELCCSLARNTCNSVKKFCQAQPPAHRNYDQKLFSGREKSLNWLPGVMEQHIFILTG